MAAPELPDDVKKAIESYGYTVGTATNFKDFYTRLGLSSNPNDTAQIGFTDKLGNLKREKALEKLKEKQPEEVVVNLPEVMDKIPDKDPLVRHLGENDFKIMAQLKTRYGNDFEMMAMDRRRNPWQLNVNQLKKKMAMYDREVEEISKMQFDQPKNEEEAEKAEE